MSNVVLNFGHSVSLNEFATAIETVGGKVTIIGQGEPGIGKTALAIRAGLPAVVSQGCSKSGIRR